MALDAEPSDEWIRFFDAGPTQGTLNPPHVEGDEIVVGVARSQSLPEHVANIDARIAYANRHAK